jgi:hypothetical protein
MSLWSKELLELLQMNVWELWQQESMQKDQPHWIQRQPHGIPSSTVAKRLD